MKAYKVGLLEFLRGTQQFEVPIYQRMYSWTEEHCKQLCDDILRCGSNNEFAMHFIGSIVFVASEASHRPALLVIDGQQRLTTIMLFLEALADALETVDSKGKELPKDYTSGKLRNYYLLNSEEDKNDDLYYKLILSQTDKNTLKAILSKKLMPDDISLRINANYKFIKKYINDHSDELEFILTGLEKLVIVAIGLESGQDNPQLVFESMNSTGKPLDQADLIRNYMLMGLKLNIQKEIYKDYWRPMEITFGQEAYNKHFDAFMRDYLTLKIGRIVNSKDIYREFKIYKESNQLDEKNLVKDIGEYAKYYCSMALGREKDYKLRLAFKNLVELKVSTIYPFLLMLYHDYEKDILSKNDFLEALIFCESYVFRLIICGVPTGSRNSAFANFPKALREGVDNDDYLGRIKKHFLLLRGNQAFPSNARFKESIKSRNLYKGENKKYWLEKIENHNRKEIVLVSDYTIEHIMPQNIENSNKWKQELGENWREVHQELIHNLGNLTLSAHNSNYSNFSFCEKRDMKDVGLKHSPLKLNQGLGQIEKWNKEAINKRAEKLTEEAIEVWPFPTHPEIDENRTDPEIKHDYSLDDYPFLDEGSFARELFDELRDEIMTLDSRIKEEFQKTFISYKLSTNFAQIVVQRNALKIFLYMNFPDIEDPYGLCRDVSKIGSLGNGNVEVRLSDLNDLSYVMDLVRASFEKQIKQF